MNESKQLRAALESANELCMSMAVIVQRHGRGDVPWEAYADQLRESLALQHDALHPPRRRRPPPSVKPYG